MGVLVETVRVEELIEYYSLGWQPMIAIVLIVLVSELVHADAVSS